MSIIYNATIFDLLLFKLWWHKKNIMTGSIPRSAEIVFYPQTTTDFVTLFCGKLQIEILYRIPVLVFCA